MYTSVIGFPRIGTLRELKFTLEKYFRQEIEAEELLRTAQELRKTHWNTQKEAGIDYIPGNDFSYTDPNPGQKHRSSRGFPFAGICLSFRQVSAHRAHKKSTSRGRLSGIRLYGCIEP